VRDIIQPKLVGEQGRYGTGMIPAHTMHHISHKGGAPGAVDTAWVNHISGGLSALGLKSYEQSVLSRAAEQARRTEGAHSYREKASGSARLVS
jgi:hypothetical protein